MQSVNQVYHSKALENFYLQFSQHKQTVSYFSAETYVVGTYEGHLTEMHLICSVLSSCAEKFVVLIFLVLYYLGGYGFSSIIITDAKTTNM